MPICLSTAHWKVLEYFLPNVLSWNALLQWWKVVLGVAQSEEHSPGKRACNMYGLIILQCLIIWGSMVRDPCRPWLWESCEKETIAALQDASQLCRQSRRSSRNSKKKINKTCGWLSSESAVRKPWARCHTFAIVLWACAPLSSAPTKARRWERVKTKITTDVEWLRETENYAWRKDATGRVAQLPCCYLLTAHLTEEQQKTAAMQTTAGSAQSWRRSLVQSSPPTGLQFAWR